MNFRFLIFQIHIFLICLSPHKINSARSIFRPKDPLMPKIITRWQGDSKTHCFRDKYLEQEAIFKKFDYDYIKKHKLPLGPIKYRNKAKTVRGSLLNKLTNNLLIELDQRKTEFTDFKVLKSSDFNRKNVCGNLVLKYKDYPFVLKLFIETPESFTKPFSKGWQPACFFLMSGGINRYLSGLTRIKNLEWIKKRVNQSTEYKDKIDFPRKWFWLPTNNRWFELKGKNITVPEQTIKLPSIYAIVADAINKDDEKEVFKTDSHFGLKLSYYLDSRLDPNFENFMLEKETGKIVIVDTEHFPSMVGLKNPTKFNSYTDWYLKLAFKCLTDRLTRHKKFRRTIQFHPISTIAL